MSIASQLTALEGNISDAYDMVAQRGGTVPARKNMENLDDAIATIPSGGGGGISREVSAQGVYQMPTTSFTFSLPNTANDVGHYGLYRAFYSCTGITSANFSSLTSLSGIYAMDSAFSNCTNLASIDFSSLTTVSGTYVLQSTFSPCDSLTSVDFSSLTTISGSSAMRNIFNGCSNLSSIDFSSLTTISGSYAMNNAFAFCPSLTTATFNALSDIKGNGAMSYAFSGCIGLTSVSFPALTTTSFGTRVNQFDNMLNGCTGVTVHFPAAIQSTIGSWASVTSGFSGTNTTVLFDL